MLYLAWDIDGTLLLTNRAGYDALQEAICDYFFRKEPYEFKHTLAGCTDSSIIKEIVTDIQAYAGRLYRFVYHQGNRYGYQGPLYQRLGRVADAEIRDVPEEQPETA